MIQPIPKRILKFVRQLNQKKYRKEHRLFIISGLRAVTQALEAKNVRIKFLLIEKDRMALLNQLPSMEYEAIFGLSPSEFAYMSDEKTPQGIALVVHRPDYSLSSIKVPKQLIYLEQINDPGNLGTILRTALWFDWNVLLLGKEATDPYQPKVVRSSAGAITQLNIVENVGLEQIAEIIREKNFRLIGTSVKSGTPLPAFRPEPGTGYILAFGSEAHGISGALSRMCHHQLTIPKAGQGESLNLGVSVSLFLYQFFAGQYSLIRKDA